MKNIYLSIIFTFFSFCFTIQAQTEIRTADELKAIGKNAASLAGSYILQNHIIVNNWTPIATGNDAFTGTFDGNGYTITIQGEISEVTSNQSDAYNAGLFGFAASQAVIRNLKTEGTVSYSVSGKAVSHVGGIAGYNCGTIVNCVSNVKVVAGGETNSTYAGGIAGMNWNGTIENCYNTGSVLAKGNGTGAKAAGGIAGLNSQNGTILNCYTTGSVAAEGTNGIKYAGGIAGSESEGFNGKSIIANNVVLSTQITASGSSTHIYAGHMFGNNSKTLKASNNYVNTGMKLTGTKNADNAKPITLANTQAQSWWERLYSFGDSDDQAWSWDIKTKRPVLYWEKLARPQNDPVIIIPARTAVNNTGTGTVKYEDDTYTVGIASVTDDGKGNIAVKIKTEENINVALKNGAMTAPMMAKIVAGGKTIETEDNISVSRNEMGFTFKSAEAPTQVIITGNDGKGSEAVFNIDKSMVKTLSPAPAVVAAAQPEPVQSAAQPNTIFAPLDNKVEEPPVKEQPAPVATQPAVQTTQAAQVQPVVPFEKNRKWFLDVGFSFYLLKPDVNYALYDDMMVFFGLNFTGGVHITKNNLLSLELGVYFHSEDIMPFTYTKTYDSGKTETFDDGEITRDYTIVPVLFSWNYIFHPGKKFHIRLGPTVGFTSLSGRTNFDPSDLDNIDEMEEEVEQQTGFIDENEALFSYGGGLGLTWDIAKRCRLDFGYRILGNTMMITDNLDVTAPTHQINMSFGWKF